jgi:hypothetical protein
MKKMAPPEVRDAVHRAILEIARRANISEAKFKENLPRVLVDDEAKTSYYNSRNNEIVLTSGADDGTYAEEGSHFLRYCLTGKIGQNTNPSWVGEFFGFLGRMLLGSGSDHYLSESLWKRLYDVEVKPFERAKEVDEVSMIRSTNESIRVYNQLVNEVYRIFVRWKGVQRILDENRELLETLDLFQGSAYETLRGALGNKRKFKRVLEELEMLCIDECTLTGLFMGAKLLYLLKKDDLDRHKEGYVSALRYGMRALREHPNLYELPDSEIERIIKRYKNQEAQGSLPQGREGWWSAV